MRPLNNGHIQGHEEALQAPALTGAREDATLRRAALVQSFPLFASMSQSDCRDIVSRAHECEFSRGEKIFLEGDPVRSVTLLISGSAKIIQLAQNGTEVILRIVGPGDIVMGFCLQCSHGSLAQVRHDSRALVWDTSVFEALVVRFPELQRNVLDILSHRLRELEERYREVSTENVGTRLSHQLMRLFTQVGQRTNGTIEINLSREELAQLTGTTLFTVSRLLSNWRERGVLRARRETVSVQNVEALRQLAESE